MGKAKLYVTATIAIILLVISVASCAKATPATIKSATSSIQTTASSTATSTSVPKTEAPAKDFVFGISTSLSGSAAQWGIAHQRTFTMSADKINAAGGFVVQGQRYKLVLDIQDSKYNTTEAVSVVNKLIFQDKVQYMFQAGTALTLAIQPITEKNKVLTINGSYGGSSITNPQNPLTFRHVMGSDAMVPAIWSWIQKNWPEVKTVAMINPNDDSGRSDAKVAKGVTDSMGYTTIDEEYYERGKTDFYPTLTKMAAMKPDLINLSCSPVGDSSLMVKQLRELGYKGHIVLGWWPDETMLPLAGASALEGTIGIGTITDMVTPELQKFHDEYVAKWGEWDGGSPMHEYVLRTLVAAIQKANTFDTTTVANVMADMPVTSLFGAAGWGGQSVYGIKRQFLHPMPITQFKSGKLVTVSLVPPPSNY